jgi:hypothetical protein
MFPQGLYNLPIPMQIYMPTDYDDKRFLGRALTSLRWCLWPRRCQVSRKWMWLTPAYRAMYVINGPGEPAIWFRWYSTTEFLILQLKGYTHDDLHY